MKFEIMKALRREFSLVRMAKWFGVSRAGYYAHFKPKPASPRARADIQLSESISTIHKNSRCTYGVDRIRAELQKLDVKCHARRISRLMKCLGIQGKMRIVKVRTTNSAHSLPVSPNLVNQNFHVASANQVWVSDITYVPTHEGWLYLCTIMDLFSRKIVGWSMSSTMESSFVVRALRMAIERRDPPPGTLTFHSDRGVQYASGEFRAELQIYRITQSMSRKGNCLDNACAESFFGTLKSELPAQIFWSRVEAQREIFDYIEGFYNPKRSHSYLGYVSPDQFELLGKAA